MQVERLDSKGNKISRNEIHTIIHNNKTCNEIISNTMIAIKINKYENK